MSQHRLPHFGASHADPSAVRLLVLDCDGVLTDGSITYDDQGRELKSFCARDGVGIKAWRRAGFEVAIITGRGGPVVRHRAEELGIEHLIEGSKDKRLAFESICEATGIAPEQAAALGDDWPDLAMFDVAHYSIAPHDAHADLRSRAHYVTPSPGGRGAVREAIEHLLTAHGLLQHARDLARGAGPSAEVAPAADVHSR